MKNCKPLLLLLAAPILCLSQDQGEPAPQSFQPPPIRYAVLKPNGRLFRDFIFLALAGQEISISNTVFVSVVVESDQPVTVKMGTCHAEFITKVTCTDLDVNDAIVIYDLRRGEPPDTSPRNRVKLTGIDGTH
jgi:hypothetical protein